MLTNEERLKQLSYSGFIPTEFLCPISNRLMNVPITLSSGITYDKNTLKLYFAAQKNRLLWCPVSGKPIDAEELEFHEDIIIQQFIVKFIEQLEAKNSNKSDDIMIIGSTVAKGNNLLGFLEDRNYTVLNQLLENGILASRINNLCNESQWTLLKYAVQLDDLPLLNYLLRIPGIEPNQGNKNGVSALDLAVAYGRVAIVLCLLPFEDTVPPLHLIGVALRFEHHYLAAKLVKEFLFKAIADNNYLVLNQLKQKGILSNYINVFHSIPDYSALKVTPLMYAVFANNLTMVNYLLDIPGIDINAQTSSGLTAFSMAFHFNRIEILDRLTTVSNVNFSIELSLPIKLHSKTDKQMPVNDLAIHLINAEPSNAENLARANYTGPIPKDLICPISGQIMTKPITLTSGHTVDSTSVKNYFRGNQDSIIFCPAIQTFIHKKALQFKRSAILTGQLKRFMTQCQAIKMSDIIPEEAKMGKIHVSSPNNQSIFSKRSKTAEEDMTRSCIKKPGSL